MYSCVVITVVTMHDPRIPPACFQGVVDLPIKIAIAATSAVTMLAAAVCISHLAVQGLLGMRVRRSIVLQLHPSPG